MKEKIQENMQENNQENMGEKHKFINHKECEYFPCHKTDKPEEFSCLFCYCPLYALGRECGGNFSYLENGIKDCSRCLVPHKKGNYDYVTGKLMELYKGLQEKEIAEHPDLYPDFDADANTESNAESNTELCK